MPALFFEVSQMNLDRVDSGRDLPNDFNVIIEIPMHGDPIKYEVDKATGAMFVDRFMSTAMHYPCNYGYIPHTISDDGDPVDVLVMSPVPLITGVVGRWRPGETQAENPRRLPPLGGASKQADVLESRDVFTPYSPRPDQQHGWRSGRQCPQDRRVRGAGGRGRRPPAGG